MNSTAIQLLRKLWRRKAENGPASRRERHELITVGDFSIDLETRTATLHGRDLGLNGAEFDLLVFLADHPKQLVTPQTMLATRWAGQGARQRQFVRVLMSLRGKLEADGSAKRYIQTEPWVFYRFNPHAM
jgi:two-component system KDP operon response regulator KdpE